MKVLNLDEMAKPKQSVTLGGKTYPVKEMTVEGFIEFSKRSQELTKGKDDERTAQQDIELMVSTISYALPDCPAEELKKLSIGQLTTLVEFLNGTLQDSTSVTEQPEEGAPGKS